MTPLYAGVTQLFYQLSLLFFWPVAAALLLLLAASLYDLGRVIVEAYHRRQQPPTDLVGLSVALAQGSRETARSSLPLTRSLRHFWSRVDAHLLGVGSREHLDMWLEEALQHEEAAAASRLDRTRALVRLGPMLGLAGTIIPLGPALHALLGGDLPGMVNHLVVGFGAVVCGLVLSGIAYVVTLVRERWARRELLELEHLCELMLRAVRTPRVEGGADARVLTA